MGQVHSSETNVDVINAIITAMVNANDNDQVLEAVHKYAGQLNTRSDILPEWVTDSICLITLTFIVGVVIFLKVTISQFRRELDDVIKKSSRTHDRTLVMRGPKTPSLPVDHGHSTDEPV